MAKRGPLPMGGPQRAAAALVLLCATGWPATWGADALGTTNAATATEAAPATAPAPLPVASPSNDAAALAVPAAPASPDAPAVGDDHSTPLADTDSSMDSGGPPFLLHISAPAPLDAFLRQHLELRRFQELPDLTRGELEQLLATAPDNIRQLLGTQGHFAPVIQLELDEDKSAATDAPAPTSGDATSPQQPPTVRITVQPGPLTRVTAVDLQLYGDALIRPEAAPQRQALTADWALPRGRTFTQAGWDGAKGQALRRFSAQRYPKAQLAHSLADIDPATHSARLEVAIDSGPHHRFGDEIDVRGHRRYDPDMVRRLVRLGGVRPGVPYDEALLQAAQQRLSASGYFESAFVQLDPDSDPEHAVVRARVREARLQKVVAGIGASTDNGARLSLEHTHHQIAGLGWRAVSKLQLERDTSTLGSELTSPVNERGRRWITGAQLQQRTDTGGLVTHSQQIRAGQAMDSTWLDQSLFLQLDRARTTDPALAQQAEADVAISANYAWTQRRFNDLTFPTQGHGLAAEVGVGLTLAQVQKPYLRGKVRWQGYWPLAQASSRPSRLALRLEGGAIWREGSAPVPSTQRFLAGGDQSVRGYTQRSIGVPRSSGLGVDPGYMLGVVSVEWQRPLWRNGQRSPWEAVLFVDSGAVANRVSDFERHTGVGTGVRYQSPVGPLQADLAYGLATREYRLHMSVGFTF